MRVLGFSEYASLNESFLSSKLKEIISMHGMPKYSWDNILLHDVQDSEILGVMTPDEWYDFHEENAESYCVNLKDGYCLALGNIDRLKGWFSNERFLKEFERRRDERHPGNELNGLNGMDKNDALKDASVKSFKEKKDELIHRKNLESMKEIVGDEIGNLVLILKDEFQKWFDEHAVEYDKSCDDECEFEFDFLGRKLTCSVSASITVSDEAIRSGAGYHDVSMKPETISIYDDELDDVFDVMELSGENGLKNLFDVIVKKDVESRIYDYYDYYGVKPSDFY